MLNKSVEIRTCGLRRLVYWEIEILTVSKIGTLNWRVKGRLLVAQQSAVVRVLSAAVVQCG